MDPMDIMNMTMAYVPSKKERRHRRQTDGERRAQKDDPTRDTGALPSEAIRHPTNDGTKDSGRCIAYNEDRRQGRRLSRTVQHRYAPKEIGEMISGSASDKD